MKFLFTILIIIPTWLSGATVRGTVKSEESSRPLMGSIIQIIKPSGLPIKGCHTDAGGNFLLEGLPVDNYTIRVNSIGYFTSTVSFSILKDEDLINLDIKLKAGKVYIDTVSEIENYHRSFSKLKPEDILDIIVDSLEFQKIQFKGSSFAFDFLLHSTFTNKTDKDIFVLADLPCYPIIKPVVKNSRGEIVKKNMRMVDCMEKNIPASSDFLVIHPHSSIKYPPVKMTLYNFLNLPKDTYTIRMIYSFKRPNKLPGVFSNPELDYKNIYKEAFLYFNTALRGEYTSSNEVKFDNSFISWK
ncbi:MAG: carboxypeptidase regulatory-like domain-containing protein [Syntrophomonadaceae bacterium]